MSQITDKILHEIMPNAPDAKREASLPIINKVAYDYKITNQRRIAAWLSTLAAESGELKYQEEIASGSAYEGREDLGNTEKGDGKRFKGRGRIQITGRFNYQSYTDYLRKNKHLPFIDFVAEPRKLAQEPYATDSAGWFFAVKIKANPIADRGDFLTTQVRVNGRNKKTGLPNHWGVRQRFNARGLSALPKGFQLTAPSVTVSSVSADVQAPPDTIVHDAADPRPLLKAGSRGPAVEELQKLLNLEVDGKFGPKTELAVKDFQSEHDLEIDGKVGPETWAALLKDSAASGQGASPATPSDAQGTAQSSEFQQSADTSATGSPPENSSSVEIKDGEIKAETNQPTFKPENIPMTAPAKDGSEAKSQTMTILGITIPTFLIPIITGIKQLITDGYLDARELFGSILEFLKGNIKYVFILIGLIIVVMLVKKAFKQLTFLLQMYINARADMHNVTVKAAPDAPTPAKSWYEFWK